MSALGSKVDGGLVLADGIVTEMQMAREVKRKAAKNESFIVLFFVGLLVVPSARRR